MEIKPGTKIPKPVITQAECDAYSAVVDAIAAHETAILQYMTDYGADFRILDEPLLITGIGAAFSVDDDRGLAQELMDTFAQMRQDGTMQEIVGRYLEHPETYLEVECLEP